VGGDLGCRKWESDAGRYFILGETFYAIFMANTESMLDLCQVLDGVVAC